MAATPFDRGLALGRLADEAFDVVVVGGGITGTGVALDAASRGLRVALVERDDLASGTSSKSSKLVHGGLRYLQQREFGLVYEALAERQRLRSLAPHLVHLLPFMIPVLSKDGLMPAKLARALGSALWMYDLTGAARIGKLHERLDADEAWTHMPSLKRERLAGGYLYHDARADDARLCLAVARTACLRFGAAVANHAAAAGLLKDASGRVRALAVEADGRRIEVRTRAVVNAAGVWADEVDAFDEPGRTPSLRPAKGVHVTVPRGRLGNDVAVVLPVPKDKRSVFVVPWGELTFIGTTDTDHDGGLGEPTCTPDDVAYLLRAVNVAVTEPLSEADVVGTWAGLRPLVRSAGDTRTADLSRRHSVRTSPSGVVTVTGGKLTTYRRMAADAVDAVVEDLDLGRRRSRTADLPLQGADGYDASRAAADGESPAEAGAHLLARYGGEQRVLTAMLQARPELGRPLVPGLPYLAVEGVFAARYEMARTLDDVLSRRTRARLLAAEATAAAAEDVAALVGPDLGWSAAERRRQVDAYRSSVAAERDVAGLPPAAGATAASA